MVNLLKIIILFIFVYNVMWILNGFDYIVVVFICIRFLISKMCEKILCNFLKLN